MQTDLDPATQVLNRSEPFRTDQWALEAWVRRDLARQFGAMMFEPLPADLLSAVATQFNAYTNLRGF